MNIELEVLLLHQNSIWGITDNGKVER
jgi:hypothetical protein